MEEGMEVIGGKGMPVDEQGRALLQVRSLVPVFGPKVGKN